MDEPLVHFFAPEVVGFGVLVVRKAIVAYPLIDGAAGVVAREVVAQFVYVHPFGRAAVRGILLQEEGEFVHPVAELGKYAGHTVKGDSVFCRIHCLLVLG